MAYAKARAYGVTHVGQIIPLDKETCKEMINYTLTLPDNEIESHLLNILGPSDDSFKMISEFMTVKRSEDDLKKMQQEKIRSRKELVPMPVPTPKKSSKQAWGTPEKNVSQGALKPRLLNNTTSVTVSQLTDLKPSKTLSKGETKRTHKKNRDSMSDIEAVLNDLTMDNAQNSLNLESSSTVNRVCNCMATAHPLFEVAPNCLNCGKVICSKEGLQPCSSCGNELLSEDEKSALIEILRAEKSLVESKKAAPAIKVVQSQPCRLVLKKIKYGTVLGSNLWKAQDAALKQVEENAKKQRELEAAEAQKAQERAEQEQELAHYRVSKDVNAELLKAQERLETLLHFQETGAERSKIIDNASDFEVPGVSSGSMWLSPVERALQLKKQQKQLRKIQVQEKACSERTKKIVEMVIRDGKLNMVEKEVLGDDGKHVDENEEMDGLEQMIKEDKLAEGAAFAKKTWDPIRDRDKWEKPIYTPTIPKSLQKSLPESGVRQNLPIRKRVQQNKLDDAELVAAMYS